MTPHRPAHPMGEASPEGETPGLTGLYCHNPSLVGPQDREAICLPWDHRLQVCILERQPCGYIVHAHVGAHPWGMYGFGGMGCNPLVHLLPSFGLDVRTHLWVGSSEFIENASSELSKVMRHMVHCSTSGNLESVGVPLMHVVYYSNPKRYVMHFLHLHLLCAECVHCSPSTSIETHVP